MAQRKPIVLHPNGREHMPLFSGDKLVADSIPVSAQPGNSITVFGDGLYCHVYPIYTSEGITGNGSAEDPIRLDKDWLENFILSVICPGDCWSVTTPNGVQETYRVPASGYYEVFTVGSNSKQSDVMGSSAITTVGYNIIWMDMCATFDTSAGATSTFTYRDKHVTGTPGSVTTGADSPKVIVRFLGGNERISAAKEAAWPADIPSWGVPSSNPQPDVGSYEYGVYGQTNIASAAGNTAQYFFADLTFSSAGEHTVQGWGDDQFIFFFDGNKSVAAFGSAAAPGTKGTFNVPTPGTYRCIVYNLNIPNGTPSWFTMNIVGPNGVEVYKLRARDWNVINTTLDCG